MLSDHYNSAHWVLKEADTWQNVADWPDPIAPLWERYTEILKDMRLPESTGLSRENYLHVISGIVVYFAKFQNDKGAVIDPYHEVEIQYSTPCFALAAATLFVHDGREDLLEPAACALEWSIITLSQRRAATSHEDFFPPLIAHTLSLVKSKIEPARFAEWIRLIKGFDPYDIYRVAPGDNNWNVVALSGEGLFYLQGLRENNTYVEHSLAAQGQFFNSPWGLYTEGPMAYDLFPRIWVADLLASGYTGYRADILEDVLGRGVKTSLFMQSPAGELPAGGRSAHHQWNEAEQCVMFEVYASKAILRNDLAEAGSYKRASHLALKSLLRWIRPSGELWIVKNRRNPANQHGYESYSSHSQYNLLTAAMLALAFKHAERTEAITEYYTPAEVGGFVFQLPDPFNKLIANVGGHYLLIDYYADLTHNPTGLLRIHQCGMDPQLGPSDGLTETAAYHLPDGPQTSAAVGVSWIDCNGSWRRLAEYGHLHGQPGQYGPVSAELDMIEQSPERVVFSLTYHGEFNGPQAIIERYTLTPDTVIQNTELLDYDGASRLIWPILANDGVNDLAITTIDDTIRVSSKDSTQTFTTHGAYTTQVLPERYGCRNGWARIAVSEFGPGIMPAIVITSTIVHD